MLRLPALASFLAVLPAAAIPPQNYRLEQDWLVRPAGFKAAITRDAARNEVTISNGLLTRTFRTGPGFATVAYSQPTTGESLIRAVRPEGSITLDGREIPIGGLSGQPNHAFLTDGWLKEMKPLAGALKFTGMETGTPVAPFPWKKVRHHAPDVEWPPKGVAVRFDFEMPGEAGAGAVRKVVWEDRFLKMDPAWKVTKSSSAERVSFQNEGKAGEIYAQAHVHCFADRPLTADVQAIEATIDPGTDTATSWGPGLGLVFEDRVIKVNLRPGDRGEHGHFELRDNGAERLAKIPSFAAADGGLSTAKPYRLRAILQPGVIRWEAAVDQEAPAWQLLFEVPWSGAAPKAVRIGKMNRSGGAGDAEEVGEWTRSRILGVTASGAPVAEAPASKSTVNVSVHYELYDGIPLLTKWITVTNRGEKTVLLNRFNAETLALVEASNHVETRDGVPLPKPQSLRVETDMAFGGFDADQANRLNVHYLPDPDFKTQVTYTRSQPCLLKVQPTRGPAQDIAPGATFTSFRVYELGMDSADRERRGLAYRKMMRTLAPWTTENPLMMHMRDANQDRVRAAIDQCAEVGFEMLILSFGSGFDAENEDPAYLAGWKKVNEYAASKGIELGCYSLYSSRRIGGGNDIVTPPGEGAAHGNCPAVTSPWGQKYVAKLRNLFDKTGFTVFEHDGPYPGDTDVTARPPLQRGIEDSQWVHWRIWSDFYRDLRAKGVFINAPDYYYTQGSNKCGMGYREANWSLPRAEQLIHTRQNIYDGTWEKTPSMGWMFVPLSEYQGGGQAATIEPLDTHIDHYERMILSNLALGVQACYRGPRLFDTPRVRDMLKKNVTWFKEHREILESDVLHLRRADGRSLDGFLHVNPGTKTPAMLVVFNPTDREISETWTVPLYYAGLAGKVALRTANGTAPAETDRFCRIKQTLRIPPGGFQWIAISPGRP